jgi:long-chain fatty acid transport protein
MRQVLTKWCVPAVLGACVVLAAGSGTARGGGFEVPQQGARAAGRADAFIATADDPSAVFYNPAGLTQVDGTQVMGGVMGVFANWDFQGDNGTEQSMNDTAYLPHLYITSDLGTERWRVGFGINAVHGLLEDWGTSGPLAQIVDRARLSVLTFSPAVAYKFDEHFSAGVALNIYYADLHLQRQQVLGPPPIPTGQFNLDGHDWAVGVTPAVHWRIDDRNSIGAYYRSPVTLDVHGEGEVEVPGIPDVGPSRTNLPIHLPQQIGLGYAMRPIDPLTIEADVLWTDWNSFDRLEISSDNPAFNGNQVPADWRSGFTYRIGAEYALNRNWRVRAGYAYSQNAIPNATFTPIVPDSDYHLLAAGIGYGTDRWSVDLSYQFVYREDRDISNAVLSPTIDGHWENTMHTVMLSATYRF